MPENDRSNISSDNQNWEEEIDLRDLFFGVLDKWILLVGGPILVMVLVGSFYFITAGPQMYRLTGTVTVDYEQSEFENIDVNLPPHEVYMNKIRSKELLEPYYEEIFNPEPQVDVESAMSRFLSGLKIEPDTEAGSPLPLHITDETTNPDSTALALELMLDDLKENEYKRVEQEIRARLRASSNQEDYLQKNWDNWYPKWQGLVGDTFPDFLRPKLEAAQTDYTEATEQLNKVQREYKTAQSQLNKISSLLENEPKHYGYQQSPFFAMAFQGEDSKITEEILNTLSDKPSEIMNQAYLDLRSKRVELSEKISTLESRKENLAEQIDQIDTAVRLTEALPGLERKKKSLKSEQEFLTSNLESVQDKVSQANYLLTSLPDFIEVYPPQAPGERIENLSHPRRNTLLAGIGTFFLLLFGVVFWEIL